MNIRKIIAFIFAISFAISAGIAMTSSFAYKHNLSETVEKLNQCEARQETPTEAELDAHAMISEMETALTVCIKGFAICSCLNEGNEPACLFVLDNDLVPAETVIKSNVERERYEKFLKGENND